MKDIEFINEKEFIAKIDNIIKKKDMKIKIIDFIKKAVFVFFLCLSVYLVLDAIFSKKGETKIYTNECTQYIGYLTNDTYKRCKELN